MNWTVIFSIVTLIVGTIGAVWDVSERRIPNWVCLLFALTCAANMMVLGGWNALGSSAIHSVIALLAGMGLFAVGWIGGGDAKFYAAAALAYPLGRAIDLFFWTTLAGFILAVALILPTLVGLSRINLKRVKQRNLPYGVAIFIGFCLTRLNIPLLV